MNQLLAHVRYFKGEWIVDFSRGGAASANSFSRREMNSMPALWEYLAGCASRSPVDSSFSAGSVTIQFRESAVTVDAWFIGSEEVA